MQMQDTECDFAVFPLLADPAGYVACAWDLTANADKRDYWIAVFREQLPGLLDEAIVEAGDDPSARQRATACRDEFYAYLDTMSTDPGRNGRLDVLAIDVMRERFLCRHGFTDPYRLTKQRENDTALELLPALLSELDALSPSNRVAGLIEGVFAGNIFDMGAKETVKLFNDNGIDFHATRKGLTPRPWLVDDFDAWAKRMAKPKPYRAALIFVDNAGADIVLGMIPFARELLQRGTRVILTSNTLPALNDIIHDELRTLIEKSTAWDVTLAQALADGRLELVASGNKAPLIDLSRVSPALVEAAQRNDVDLVVLEGMGRALESNFDAPFTCDVLKLAMIKDKMVAEMFGGDLYDVVLRFEKAG